MAAGIAQWAAPDRPEERLAAAFGTQVAQWAIAQGASPGIARAAQQAATALSIAGANGHVCLPLSALPALDVATLPVDSWRQALLSSGVVAEAETDPSRPMRLDPQDRLYLLRFWNYEQRLARRLMAAAQPAAPLLAEHEALVRSRLQAYFPADTDALAETTDATPNWQQLAVALALRRKLVIISGGPGTGKTSTVLKLLACLLEIDPTHRIALAAPTGKAAGRMAEALRKGSSSLPAGLHEKLPHDASTVHRLLQMQADGSFRYNAQHLLAIDTLVLDEASMLDLSLATRLLEAVPSHARIVLLGDHRQLAAVESGAVFAEIAGDPSWSEPCRSGVAALCGLPVQTAVQGIVPPTPSRRSPLQDCVVWFQKNYRFQSNSGIGRMARCINDGNLEALLQLWEPGAGPGTDTTLTWIDPANDQGEYGPLAAIEHVLQTMDAAYAPLFALVQQAITAAQQGGIQATTYQAIQAAFDQFRALCAVRDGTYGVQGLNAAFSARWRAAMGLRTDTTYSPWFVGRPVQILRNDYNLRLFNGDTGIALPDPNGQLHVYFAQSDGSFYAIPPSRLPSHETAFAMTVHKAQGAEFDSVLVVLPPQRSRAVSRELLYTAVTRARKQVTVCSSHSVLSQALENRMARDSGLLDRLREA